MSAHAPVLLAQVCAALAPASGMVIVDGTFGAGGYSRALLAAGAEVLGLDRDPQVAGFAQALAQQAPGLRFVQTCFSSLDEAAAAAGFAQVNGVVLDIGVSSMQIDDAERGFSFQKDGPLDMRMAQSGPSAADLVNTLEETALANLIYRYGEERQSRRVARAIVQARAVAPITTTMGLVRVVRSVLGQPRTGKDSSTLTFQALRIAVNAELDELQAGLDAAERILAPGGRLAVVTFHSLEDRIVKLFLRERCGALPLGSRHEPLIAQGRTPTFTAASKPIKADDAETARNPRARSATLRWAVRTSAPAWTEE